MYVDAVANVVRSLLCEIPIDLPDSYEIIYFVVRPASVIGYTPHSTLLFVHVPPPPTRKSYCAFTLCLSVDPRA